MGTVAGYHAVTILLSPEEVQKTCDKIANSARIMAQPNNTRIALAHTELGNPAGQIIVCAEGCGVDLIVTGRRGFGSFGSLLRGSSTQRVNHFAKCACLSVV
jgi:nucleotide-binding universal stress UspA family protein